MAFNQLNSEELIEVKQITRLELYRWSEAQITFQELLLIRVLSRHPIGLKVFELTAERCSLGYLPLVLVNGSEVIDRRRIPTLVQSFCIESNQRAYLNARAVLHACQQLVEVQRLNDLQVASRYWLLFSPFKKLREYIHFRKEVKEFKLVGISETSNNFEVFERRFNQFEKLLIVQDSFCRMIIDSCLELFRFRDGELANRVNNSSAVKKYRESRYTAPAELGKPVVAENLYIANPKNSEVVENPKIPENKPQEVLPNSAAKEAIAKTLIALTAVWLPMFIFKLASQRVAQ